MLFCIKTRVSLKYFMTDCSFWLPSLGGPDFTLSQVATQKNDLGNSKVQEKKGLHNGSFPTNIFMFIG